MELHWPWAHDQSLGPWDHGPIFVFWVCGMSSEWVFGMSYVQVYGMSYVQVYGMPYVQIYGMSCE